MLFFLKNWHILLEYFFLMDIDNMATSTFIGQGGKWRIIVTSLLEFSARRTSGLTI